MPQTPTTAIQAKLIALGYDLGPTKDDGFWGRRSIAALKAFQARNNLTPDGVPSHATRALLFPFDAAPAPVPVWFAEARRLQGLRETAGAGSNPVILA